MGEESGMIEWWCTALARPWTWEWIPYPGIWAASILPLVLYGRSLRRHEGVADRRKAAQFTGGVVAFWIASDWPLGTLGAGYLASAHMTQFLLYTLVAAPLMLLGTPEWMGRRLTRRLRLERPALWLGRNVVATAVIYNVILISTHAPGTVALLRNSQFGSFAMDVVWLLAGFLLWLPVISPLPEGRASSPWVKMAYLFVATSVVAVIPASFLTFTEVPIYGIYELAPRVISLTAVEDQQLAGIIMKIATIPIVWSTIAVLWFRWSAGEARIA
ncbi:MAG TPA: cytochrome c oxidase assembly protein [Acidimicrobiia bacterium]|nr:cytochrome c oxidase assembly protein [Acidimicrobiia bacterium]